MAYHIGAVASATAIVDCPHAAPVVIQTSDWCILQANGPRLCESMGLADDRNTGLARHGQRGACTTGRNAATGIAAPGTAAAAGALATRITRIDVCALTTTERGGPGCPGTTWAADVGLVLGNPAGVGGMLPGVADPRCNNAATADNAMDCTDDQAWDLTLGAYACAIPTIGSVVAGAPAGVTSSQDFAAYYDELYAWFSYDGDGSYTMGMAQDSNNANNDPPQPTGPPANNDGGELAAGNSAFSDEIATRHGHVSGGISPAPAPGTTATVGATAGVPGLHLFGSFVTTTYGGASIAAAWTSAEQDSYDRYAGGNNAAGAAAAPIGDENFYWEDGATAATNPGTPFPTGFSNNCGSSPSEGNLAMVVLCGDAIDPGPVVRAP